MHGNSYIQSTIKGCHASGNNDLRFLRGFSPVRRRCSCLSSRDHFMLHQRWCVKTISVPKVPSTTLAVRGFDKPPPQFDESVDRGNPFNKLLEMFLPEEKKSPPRLIQLLRITSMITANLRVARRSVGAMAPVHLPNLHSTSRLRPQSTIPESPVPFRRSSPSGSSTVFHPLKQERSATHGRQ